MAPVKPMGPDKHTGVGFHQEYNQDPGARQDLNPDVVTDPDALPTPLAQPKPVRAAVKTPKAPKAKK